METQDIEPELFIGESCGCNGDSVRPDYFRRSDWDTDMSLSSMFSPLNYMDEDMLAQTSFTGLVSTIFASMYYINGFDSFNLCLNPSLGAAEEPFEKKIMHVISSGDTTNNKDRILTETYFDREEMLPDLYESRPRPAAFYFMPLYYEKSVFGYAAVSYGDKQKVISAEYRAWLRSVSRGIECYRRAEALIGSTTIAKTGVTTDSLTGLPNYLGFLERSETLLHLMHNNGGYMGVLAIDIKDLSGINDTYGSKEGDRAIITTASTLEKVFASRNCMCFRVGNDEMVVIRITRSTDDAEMLAEKDRLMTMITERVKASDMD